MIKEAIGNGDRFKDDTFRSENNDFEQTREEGIYDLDEIKADDIIDLYKRETAQVPLLTRKEEQHLAARVELGQIAAEKLSRASVNADEATALKEQVKEGEQARNHLVKANARLVMSIVKRYLGYGVPFPDLIQTGNLALMKAVKKFDYKRGYKFSTYASWWIRQGASRAIADQGRTIRLPIHFNERVVSLRTLASELEKAWGREPTIEELAEELGTEPEEVRFMLRVSQSTLSLEMPVGPEEDTTLKSFLEDTEAPTPPNEAAQRLLVEDIEAVLMTLTTREERILRYRFGLHDGQSHTLEEVGQKFGLTRERIRQLERQALNKLRHSKRAQRLKAYWDTIE
jgi:RNA polymerase primary sigma factor